ncbi:MULTISPECIES: hypothetical protein [unclassified Devosia]|uniref:hypothetical protein n=1 Tax=unclassified Devosia TaxID=196773 RepID=UPI00145F1720|nr:MULTISPECIES: hypothetical protein [unclassified Devosia]MBJ6987674.1 hypothetical protein [Devosia sp. MC521]MBJ7578665.1 hypothetical protein [Devosia sp. MC532]MBK1795372.1 hypothetical protein [Devosia sp. WQ 349K1]QMW62354.1 hypothetical protein H4N61_15740 [Devosia sp. MC521]
MACVDRNEQDKATVTHWLGRSGRDYGLVPENLSSFSLNTAALYVLAEGSVIAWAGTADDLIVDTSSRAKFRQALENATDAFSMDCPDNAQAVVWDLVGTPGPAHQHAA